LIPIFVIPLSGAHCIYLIKELVQPKKSLYNRKFFIWKKRGRGERERGVARSAGR
jgi:hypothetical protein